MCVICGCSSRAHAPVRPAARRSPPAAPGVAGVSRTRAIRMEADVLAANQQFASANRHAFAANGVRAFNLMSSPGSGKTTLLCATIRALRARDVDQEIAVVEGDQHTAIDAARIRASGCAAIQVNTGRVCHLDGAMVGRAFEELRHSGGRTGPADFARRPGALLFIENVGNLVCPALWDLGEAAAVVLIAVTEGDDKPLKYPDIFAGARLMVINKIDLLPYVDFDVDACVAYARRVNPEIAVLLISAARGDGLSAWLDLLLAWPLPVQTGRPVSYRALATAAGGAQ